MQVQRVTQGHITKLKKKLESRWVRSEKIAHEPIVDTDLGAEALVLVLVNENVLPADAADPDDWRTETLSLANAPLVDKQAGLPLAQAWGGGLVAAADGMRCVVPARPRSPAQPQVLRFQTRHDLAERHERPRYGPRGEGRVGDDPRLPAHGRRHLRPGRRG
ncbi:Tn3 family transposase [Streptosporangium canum]|uniref:Tn3 family transposase n=1 Tax=Streptosporangium canum TaxID=324952 RepID=UPI00343EC5F0